MAEMKMKRHGDLDIDHNPKHSETQWKVQHIGWILMMLVLLMGLLGLLGPGPLSHRTWESESLVVRYDHFLHVDTPTTLEAKMQQDADSPTLLLDQSYLQDFKIEDIHPAPNQVSIQEGKYHVTFHRLTRGAVIQMHVIPQHFGAIQGTLQLEGQSDTIPIKHWIYP